MQIYLFLCLPNAIYFHFDLFEWNLAFSNANIPFQMPVWGGQPPSKFHFVCFVCQKTTFTGRRPLIEDDLRWKMTFNGRRPLMEDDLRWKMTFNGRRPLMEDYLWWKTNFDGRGPLMEDDLWWKTTFNGRWQWGRPQEQRGLAHCWKAYSAGHIVLRYFLMK